MLVRVVYPVASSIESLAFFELFMIYYIIMIN
ncbi:hypothetical protein C8E03_102510 [Lachnotalea glycerini]|uniref:Uncharacterized protein n=1 Tax=Lachnotalea glycerini TaxID=1763509 RepID=A0A318EQI9_9FIRM|nr:hypothetical protein C8E03_102510 [Lachnotalea glycerini]